MFPKYYEYVGISKEQTYDTDVVGMIPPLTNSCAKYTYVEFICMLCDSKTYTYFGCQLWYGTNQFESYHSGLLFSHLQT